MIIQSKYVSLSIIADLESINENNKSQKIIDCCNRINLLFKNKDFGGVLVSVREIIDCCMPIFGGSSFSVIVNNFGFSASDKKILQRLELLRILADNELHSPVKNFEIRPTENLANFSQELEVLLVEITKQIKSPKNFPEVKNDTAGFFERINILLNEINPLILQKISSENPSVSINLTQPRQTELFNLIKKFSSQNLFFINSNGNTISNNTNSTGGVNDLADGWQYGFDVVFLPEYWVTKNK